MLPADMALAFLMNRTTDAYVRNQPSYITYRERTHVTVPSLGRSQDINRSVAVRVADDAAVMRDLPNGGQRTGQAFPVIPYIDPLFGLSLSYYANLKRVDITVQRVKPFEVRMTPQSSANANVTVGYFQAYAPTYADDSSDQAVHLMIAPTSAIGNNTYYPSEVIEDGTTHLPRHIEMRLTGSDETVSLDYGVLEGHWVLTHGTFSATQHAGPLTFKVIADVTYDQFAFPNSSPDPRI